MTYVRREVLRSASKEKMSDREIPDEMKKVTRWNIQEGRNDTMDTNQAAIYVRTYPRDEVAERNTTEAQIAQCLQFAQEQGYSVSEAHIYQDVAGGMTLDRIGLEHLKKAMQEHEFSVLIVDDL